MLNIRSRAKEQAFIGRFIPSANNAGALVFPARNPEKPSYHLLLNEAELFYVPDLLLLPCHAGKYQVSTALFPRTCFSGLLGPLALSVLFHVLAHLLTNFLQWYMFI